MGKRRHGFGETVTLVRPSLFSFFVKPSCIDTLAQQGDSNVSDPTKALDA